MNWAATGAIALALAVMTGAFGAHALRDRLDAYLIGIWEKAVLYHFFHALGLLMTPTLAQTGAITTQQASHVCWLLAVGILFFSGSLYWLALSGMRILGAVTPLGGTAFIAAWLLLAFYLLRRR